MRIIIFILALMLMNQATAQEQAPPDYYGRPPQPAEVQPQEPDAQPPEPTTQPSEPAGLWSGVTDILKKFIPAEMPTERPIEQPLDGTIPGESPAVQRQALWEAATKLKADDESATDTSPQPTAILPHAQSDCLDPSKFQPGLTGYIDYYLFKIADTGANEVYLASDSSDELFCLTNVDTEELENDQEVVVLGYVRVRGTKTYKTAAGDKHTVRVVKLLSPKESEAADAERAIQETEHPLRTWTSKDGKHKIEARFLKFVSGKVHLVNKAGKTITISPNDLSLADRDYYRDLVKKAREAAHKKAAEEDDADSTEPFAGEGNPYGRR
jgi:hypothetical protein